jgi:hypothetical protein
VRLEDQINGLVDSANDVCDPIGGRHGSFQTHGAEPTVVQFGHSPDLPLIADPGNGLFIPRKLGIRVRRNVEPRLAPIMDDQDSVPIFDVDRLQTVRVDPQRDLTLTDSLAGRGEHLPNGINIGSSHSIDGSGGDNR